MTGDTSTDQVEEVGSNPTTRIEYPIKMALNNQCYFITHPFDIKDVYLKKIETEYERNVFKTIVPMFHSYKQTTHFVGRQLNYLIMCKNSCVGVIGLGSSVMAMKPRDTFIGWDKETRLQNLVKTANNWRFTVTPLAPKNTGSKALSLLLKICRNEWKKTYGDTLCLLETLVEPPRNGGVYLANGWVNVGETKGTEFIWMKKEVAEKYVSDNPNASICSKNMKFGDSVDYDTVQVVIPNSKSKKLIFVKTLHRYWRRELNGK